MLIIRKFPKSIAGRTKRPRGPHEAHVFETPGLVIKNCQTLQRRRMHQTIAFFCYLTWIHFSNGCRPRDTPVTLYMVHFY